MFRLAFWGVRNLSGGIAGTYDILLFTAVYEYYNHQSRKRKRRWWVRPWLQSERRLHHGAYHALLEELRTEDAQSFSNFLRMDEGHFQQILSAIEPLLHKQQTNMRDSISPGERLAVTLRFLASGDSYQSLSFLYRIGRTTLGEIIPETCKALLQVLKDRYLKVPKTAVEWETIAAAFGEKWNFPHCIGAIDGKHVPIKAPPNSGSMFYNYKEFNSIVLLAMVDALYRIIWYDVGANGRNNDAGILSTSSLANALETNTLNIPAPRLLENANTDFRVPFVIVGDEAFPLKTNMMKPYPKKTLTDKQRIFNYRLSRARRVSENAFGILVNRFRVLNSAIHLVPDTATQVTEACLVLHNFLRTESDSRYIKEVQNSVRREVGHQEEEISFYRGNNNPAHAREVRNNLCDYFWGVGQVQWQWNIF